MTVVRTIGRVFRGGAFVVLYLGELCVATATVAWEIVTPRHAIRPWIVRVPISAGTDLEITGLANLISFTPGTLTIDVAQDRTALLVHGLHVSDPDRLRARIARLERRWLGVIR